MNSITFYVLLCWFNSSSAVRCSQVSSFLLASFLSLQADIPTATYFDRYSFAIIYDSDNLSHELLQHIMHGATSKDSSEISADSK